MLGYFDTFEEIGREAIANFSKHDIVSDVMSKDLGYSDLALSTMLSTSLSLLTGIALTFILIFSFEADTKKMGKLFALSESFRFVPPLLLSPLVLVLCIEYEAKYLISYKSAPIITGFLYCFAMLNVYVIHSIMNMLNEKAHYIEYAKMCGMTRNEILRRVYFRMIMPEVINGLKIIVPITIGIVMVTEYVGGTGGLGLVIKVDINNRVSICCVILYGILVALLLTSALFIAGKICDRWV